MRGKIRVKRVVIVIALVVCIWFLFSVLNAPDNNFYERESQDLADRSSLDIFRRLSPAEVARDEKRLNLIQPRHVNFSSATLPLGVLRALGVFSDENGDTGGYNQENGRRCWRPEDESCSAERVVDAASARAYLARDAIGSLGKRCFSRPALAAMLYSTWLTDEGTSMANLREALQLLDFARTVWTIACTPDSAAAAVAGNSTATTSIQAQFEETMRRFNAVLRTYVDRFGRELACNAPQVYSMPCPGHIKHAQRDDVNAHAKRKLMLSRLEHIHCDLRNEFFPQRVAALTPYITMASLSGGDRALALGGERVLIDFGAGRFHGSAKTLIDAYEVVAPFQRVVLVEPSPIAIPARYATMYNITAVGSAVRIGGAVNAPAPASTMTFVDPVAVIAAHCRPIDSCVVKFDVDRDGSRDSFEWGFLYSLIASETTLALVDELYIELHFRYPRLGWVKMTKHSMQQALDMMRELRRCGLAVHAWP